jgi:hypothetical protein
MEYPVQSDSKFAFESKELLIRVLKYAVEGLIVAFAAYFLPGRRPDIEEVFVIGMIAAATFAVLDLFAPAVGQSVRQGAGFGLGMNLIGFPANIPNNGPFATSMMR